ncbi:MAG TPA: hypothetical protein VJL09_01095 [Candidatus Paceibacterota bacterium]
MPPDLEPPANPDGLRAGQEPDGHAAEHEPGRAEDLPHHRAALASILSMPEGN